MASSPLVLLLLFSVFFNADKSERLGCRDGFIPFRSKCYWFSTMDFRYNWVQAQVVCRMLNADLLMVNSHKETIFVSGYIMSHSQGLSYWTAGQEIQTEDQWFCLQGSRESAFHYTNWAWSEPRDGKPRDGLHCTRLDSRRFFQWAATGCDTRNGVVCTHVPRVTDSS